MTAEEIIAWLKLKPHPKEGGFFSESHPQFREKIIALTVE